jgi:uncharacterized protein
MRPMALSERLDAPPTVSLAELLSGRRAPLDGDTPVELEDYTRQILSSGYPGFLGLGARALETQLGSYLSRVVDRDFAELGQEVRNPVALRRWMTACAAATSTTAARRRRRTADISVGRDPRCVRAKPSSSSAFLMIESCVHASPEIVEDPRAPGVVRIRWAHPC